MTQLDLSQLSPYDVRQLCRQNKWPLSSTAGVCAGYAQANLIILPSKYAADWRLLCRRNPVACPLIGETSRGDPLLVSSLADGCDLRTDFAGYNVYRNGKLLEARQSIEDLWTEDSVGFLIGCSFSFEEELCQAGLAPKHVREKRNVSMYYTKVPLAPAGVFSGNMVVSMRPYPASDLEKVRDITRPFVKTHGEPVAWGAEGAAALGIQDVGGVRPDLGDPNPVGEGEIPVYWACGVTPQHVLTSSRVEGIAIGHAPGQMLVLDMKNEEVKDQSLCSSSSTL